MATNPVQKDDIAVKGVADNLIKGLKKSKKAVDDLNESLIELGKTQKENIDIIKKQPDTIKKVRALNKAIKETETITDSVNETRKQSLEIDKKILAAEKKLKAANSTRIDQLTKLQVQIQEQNRTNKQLVQENDKIVGAYKAQSTRLVRLRKQYKDLAVQNKENTTEAKKLLKEITQLDKKLKDVDDTVGQNQRHVGNYGKALEGLSNTLSKLGIITAIVKGFELLGEAFGNTREGALQLQLFFANFTETAKVLINNIIEAAKGISDVLDGTLSGLKKIFSELFTIATASFRLVDVAISALSFNFDEAKEKAKQLANDLKSVPKGLIDGAKEISNASGEISTAIDKVAEAVDGTTDTTSKAIREQKKFLKLQLRTRISIEQQEKALAGLSEQRQILQDISDDDTIGFVTRAKAVERAEKAAIRFAQLETKLALTKEKLTIEAVKQDLRRANVLSEGQLAQIKTGEQLKRILLDTDKAKKVSDSNDEAFTAAFVDRRNKQVEAQAFARDAEEKFRKTARDAFEQELDIIEEFTEKRIANNEKIINSDSASLEERRRALRENQSLENELFEESIRLILEQGKASIDLRKDLTTAEKTQQKALLENVDIQKIVNEQDMQEVFNMIRKLDLGEIEEKRLKEALKIKKETVELNKESAKVDEETVTRTLELQEEVAIQDRFLAGESMDLEDEQTKNQIKNLEDRIANAKAGSIEMLELQKELNDLLIDEEKKRIEKEEALRVEQINKAQALANQVADEFAKIIKARNKENLELADAEIKRAEESVRRQEEIAANGQENILAQEQARLEKANLAKQREAERAAKQEQNIALATAFLNNLAARSKTDPETAFALALRDTLGAKLIAEGLASFYEGTEDTGTATDRLDSKGGRYAILHDNERVMTKAQNKKVGGMSNDDLANLAYDFNHGNLSPSHFKQLEVGRMMQPQGSNMNKVVDQLVKQTDRLEKAFENGQVKYNVNWNSHGEAVETREKKRVRKVITHRKRL